MRARPGSALLVVLVCMAITELIVAGALLTATRAAQNVRVAAAVTRARAGAEAAVRSGLQGWDLADFAGLPIGGYAPVAAASGVVPGGARHAATVERLTRDRWLLRGEATLAGASGALASARAAALLVTVPTDSLWLHFGAALTSGADVHLTSGSAVVGWAADTPPAPWTAATCPATARADMLRLLGTVDRPGVALGPGGAVAAPAGVVRGNPPITTASVHTDSATFRRLGSLSFAEVARLADRIAGGTVTPAPAVRANACDATVASNWGAPLSQSHPCADLFPLLFAPGDLAVAGGVGQGILVVAGDLDLLGTTFYGAVLVAGRLRANGATVFGGVRAGGGTAGPADLRIDASACALGRAFARAPALRRAHRPPGRWWLPSP